MTGTLSSFSAACGTWNGSRNEILICCSGNGCGSENDFCFGNGCVCDASGWEKSSGEPLHAVRRHHRRHGVNLVGVHSGPSGLSARARPAGPRPWRPSHPRHPACRGNAQRRNPCFPWCSDHGECTHRQPGHTSQKLDEGSRVRFGMLGCPLSGKSCPRRRAEAYRNSSR